MASLISRLDACLADTADYILKTEIMESNYHGKLISYGLSAYGPVLWIFGLPAGSSNTSLVLKMDLIDKAENIIEFFLLIKLSNYCHINLLE